MQFTAALRAPEEEMIESGPYAKNVPAPVVYVIDDDPEVCDSLEWLFGTVGFEILTFGCVADFLEDYRNRPGCLILDINLPGMSGLDFAHELSRLQITLPVIVVTASADVPTAISAMKAGAVDFVLKPFEAEKLIELVQEVIERNCSRVERRRGTSCNQRTQRLTPREREVMRILATGKTNKEIARILDIGVRTVETYRSEVMRKLDAKSLADLLRLVLNGEK